MNKVFTIILISIFLAIIVPVDISVADEEIIFQSPAHDNCAWNNGVFNAYYQFVWPFVAPETFTPTKLRISMYHQSTESNAGNVYFGIYECDDSGWPTASEPDSSCYQNGICYGTFPVASLYATAVAPSHPRYVELEFSTTVELTKGKCYGFYISRKSPSDVTQGTFRFSTRDRYSDDDDTNLGSVYNSQKYSGGSWQQDFGDWTEPLYQLYGELGGGEPELHAPPGKSNSIFSPYSGPGGMFF